MQAQLEIVHSDAVNVALSIVLVLSVAALIALFGYIPGYIAEKRGHPSRDAIRLCGYFGLLLWPLWVIALIWAHTVQKPGRRTRDRFRGDAEAGRYHTQEARARGFSPEVPQHDDLGDFPGRFEIHGVDRETALDSRLVLDADSPANARAKAELRGMVVTKVARVRDSDESLNV